MELNPDDHRAMQFYRNYLNKNLEVKLKEYHRLLETLIILHETLAELKIEFPYWKTYSDTLLTKFYLHSYSFYNILCGTEMNLKNFENHKFNTKIQDIPTAKVIQRAQLENFLMYHHIYVNPKSESEKELRFNAWIYSSLLERQTYTSNTSFGRMRKIKDKVEIEKMKITIASLPAFKDVLSSKQQEGLLKKGSKKLFKNWIDIIVETGFKKEDSESWYGLLSNYAHSEGLSVLQIKVSKLSYDKFNPQANTILFYSVQLICLMIESIRGLYEAVEEKYDNLPQELKDTIEMYNLLTQKMNSTN